MIRDREPGPVLAVEGLQMSFGDTLVQQDLTFDVRRGDVFLIIGPSGCGKSTLLRHLIGLQTPAAGTIRYGGEDLWALDEEERIRQLRRIGVLFQGGALWSSLTVAENIALPLHHYTRLSAAEIRGQVAFKLALVGLDGYQDFAPAQLSGGMRKRVGLARALALDPEILFFDEPSAGLDPVSARRLDDLILELRESLAATLVVVTHELASIFAIGSNGVFLDPEQRTMIASGSPAEMLAAGEPKVREFLQRGEA
ncbi:ATP-binding cassette domain-containing protein [Desulfuromonas carbonis]|uniref:ABC transporter ATP-binding protein n=1 Tax=Desulfuromonas sp. DDH964 TaxID=1823759 RepID=UPI00078D8355|nr:ATP-binding cassette domain-containing protein [Desulfuromonas sp. DDH964]AMV70891.1 organic solvent tolerance ABC transporter ATP-binding protein [Desulfuromonas sp. DDH964]